MSVIKTNMENFFIWLGDQPGREKLTIGGFEPRVHYTFMNRANLRVLDIHKTYEHRNMKKEHESILQMRYFTLLRFIVSYRRVYMKLFRQFWFVRRINLGKLKRNRVILFPVNISASQEEIFFDMRRRKKIKVRKEIRSELIMDMLISVDELVERSQTSFWVYSTNKESLKQNGLIFQLSCDNRMSSYYFISVKEIKRFIAELQVEMVRILQGLDFKGKSIALEYFNNRLLNKG